MPFDHPYISILPPNATPFMLAMEYALRSEEASTPHLIRTLYNPWACPIEALPHLAWALSVDVWHDDWPENVKRKVVAESLSVHRIKGSVASVKQALASVYADVELEEWFEYGGEPHTFRAIVSPSSLRPRKGQPLFNAALERLASDRIGASYLA